ncbi:MAG: enoyl-CoA hydratase [Actinomycetota bacterium]|nr:MAG: enoyl-CoA hydratase [Actinomycetota bacterium]
MCRSGLRSDTLSDVDPPAPPQVESVAGDGVVLIDNDDGVAVVTLHRPQARNALNAELAAALPGAISACDADPAVRAIVLTGSDPAFCAGFDLRDVRSGAKTGANPHPGWWGALPPTRVPVIGAINGAAVTGGLEIALACDFLVASELARFADTHAKVGMLPGWGLTILLPEAVGARRARQMSLTGDFVDAPTALAWGLVNEVVAHGELLPRAVELARHVAANPAAAVAEVRALYREVAPMGCGEETYEYENRRAREWAARAAAERSRQP